MGLHPKGTKAVDIMAKWRKMIDVQILLVRRVKRRGGERIAAERSESASQNSFLIPTSQKVAEPRVLSGAGVKNYDEGACPQKFRGLASS